MKKKLHRNTFYKKSKTYLLIIILCLLLLVIFAGIYRTRLNLSATRQVMRIATTIPRTSTIIPSFALTPTLAPSQKAIYTFYIQTTTHKSAPKGLGLKQSDSGRAFIVDIGTFISLNFGPGKFAVSLSSPQEIFKCLDTKCLEHSSPINSISSFWVSQTGYGTITVIETK